MKRETPVFNIENPEFYEELKVETAVLLVPLGRFVDFKGSTVYCDCLHQRVVVHNRDPFEGERY